MAKVLIVGAGAAGLMATGAAVRQGHQVTVLEHTDKPGQKILVTGKGRCNVTNDCTAEEFLHAGGVPARQDHGAVREPGRGAEGGARPPGVPGVR